MLHVRSMVYMIMNQESLYQKDIRKLKRYLEGSFLFVLKKELYNHITGTYDGRHGLFESGDFRDYIEDLIRMYLALFERAFRPF